MIRVVKKESSATAHAPSSCSRAQQGSPHLATVLAVTDGVGWLHFRGGKDHGVAGEGVVGLPSADDMARTQAAGGKPKVKRPKREKRHPLMEGREGSSFGGLSFPWFLPFGLPS